MNKRILVLIAFVSFFAIFFRNILFFNHVFYCCDNLLINFPARNFLQQTIQTGVLPLWYPNVFSGTPFLADINLSPLYPGQIFYLLFNRFISIFRIGTIDILFHIALAFLGTYLCAKKFGLRTATSFYTGIIYAFSGTLVTYINNLPMLQVASIFPWVFLSVKILVNKTSITRFLFTSLLITLLIIAGHPQLTVYAIIFVTTYLFIFIQESLLRKILLIAVVLGLGVCISSLQLLPFLEFSLQSTRIYFASQYANYGSLSFVQLIRFIVPSLTGFVSNGTAFWQGGSVVGYVGFIPLLIVVFGYKKQKNYLFFIIAALLSLIFSLGDNTFLYQVVKLTPVVSMFRVPTNVLFVYSFCIAILSGLALENFVSNKKKFPLYFNLGWIVGILGFCLLVYANFVSSFVLHNLSEMPGKLTNKLLDISNIGLTIYIQQIALNIILIGLSIVVINNISRNKIKYLFITVSILLSVDLFMINQGALITLPLSQLNDFEQTTTNEKYNSLDSNYRLFFDPNSYPANVKKVFGFAQMPGEILWQYKSLRPNLGVNLALRYVNGYGSMIYSPYQKYFGNVPLDPTGVNISNHNDYALDELAVKYTISRKQRSDNFTTITQRPTAKPRIRLELANGSWLPVEVVSENPNYLEVLASSTQSAVLVLAETNYPGWEVKVDGTAVTNRNNFSILQRVNVPPGIHKVSFSFKSKSIMLGILGTTIGVIVTIILLGKAMYNKLMRQKIKKNRQ